MDKRLIVKILIILVPLELLLWHHVFNNSEETSDNNFGIDLDLSSDGETVVIASPSSDHEGSPGSFGLFRYINSNWSQVGSTIYGESYNSGTRNKVAITEDGKYIAHNLYHSNKGRVKIYYYSSSDNTITQIGSNIDGGSSNYQDFEEVDIAKTSSGKLRVAIGQPAWEDSSNRRENYGSCLLYTSPSPRD